MYRPSSLFVLFCWISLDAAQGAAASSPSAGPGRFLESSPAQTCSAAGEQILRLALFDAVGLPPALTATMRRSAALIFEPAGVRIEWVDSARVAQDPVAAADDYLKVIVLPVSPEAWNLPVGTMGTVFRRGAPIGTVFLFDPAIRRTLKGTGRRPRFVSAEKTGVAYGRLLAHEVVHAVAPEMAHAASGLMARSQDRQVLVARRLDLDPGSMEALCRGLKKRQK